MIVAMLLGPIMGTSLALLDSNLKYLRKSLTALATGVVFVVATALTNGVIHRDIPITDEIISRTAPNLMDLMVALASGAVGAYATVSPRLSVAFVGVAIATALVPPLCAACILFAHGQPQLALGAVLLTFLNMVAIHFASSLVLWLSGFRPHRHPRGSSLAAFLRHNAPGLVLLMILAVGLGVSLHRMVARSLYESALRATLQRRIDASQGCHLVEVRVEENLAGPGLVRAVVRGPTPPTPAQVAEMESSLPAAPHRRPMELRIRFVHTTVLNRHGELFRDTPFGAQE
jgi:uncharacterized hydrophobic protein (TIGR00271 family)